MDEPTLEQDIERQRVEQAYIDGSVEGSPIDHDGRRRSEPGAEGLRPARVGGYRRLTFDNGRYEEYQAVFVQHESGEWDRILIARDDGTIAATLVALINGDATPAADSHR